MVWEMIARRFERPAQSLRIWRRTLLAKLLVSQLNSAATIEEKIALTVGKSKFKSNQVPFEIAGLLKEVKALRPRLVCEIGSDRGGTLALLAQCAADDALLVSIDPIHESANTKPYEHLVRRKQKLVRIGADSHLPDTLQQLRGVLNEQPLDFLFIDGDHSYDGIRQDFQTYAPLVRHSGLIAFHDIVPVQSEDSIAYVGGVPDFFAQEIAPTYDPQTWIGSKTQDGYGIGAIRWQGIVKLAAPSAYPPVAKTA